MSSRVTDFMPQNIHQSQQVNQTAPAPPPPLEPDEEVVRVQTCIRGDTPVDQQPVSSCQMSPAEMQAVRMGIQRNEVRATIEARLPQVQLLGLPTPIMPPVVPLPLPSAEQVQRGVEQLSEAVQPVLEETERTLNGMATVVLENNGVPTEVLPDVVPAMVENQNDLGRGIGHGVSLLQSAVEIEAGVGMILGGGGEALVTSPAAVTGAGAVIPGAGVATAVLGAVVTTHGVAVGVNTINNIINEPMRSQNSNPTNGSSNTPSRTEPSLAPDSTRTPRGTPERINPADDAPTTRGKTRQNEAAETLSRQGYDVEQGLPTQPNGKRPDYRIEGELFDSYAPSTSNARNIADTIKGKVESGQADRIVLNLDDSSVSLDAMRQQITDYPVPGLREIIIVKDRSVVPFFPFN